MNVGWELRSDRKHLEGESPRAYALLESKIPYDGIVTQWRYVAARSHPFKAIIWRPFGYTFEVVGINDIPSAEINKDITYTVPVADRIHVKRDYVIGFAYTAGVFRRDDVNSASDTQYVRHGYASMDKLTKGFRDYLRSAGNWAYSIQATIDSSKYGAVMVFSETLRSKSM